MTTPKRHHHFLSILLRAYEDAHGPLGTARYLQVQTLLQQVEKDWPADWPEAKWKGLLAPLFSGTPLEQEQFYSLFDDCLTEFQKIYADEPAPIEPLPPVPDPVKKSAQRWQRALIFLAATILFTLALLWLLRPPKDSTPPRVVSFSIPPGDTLRRNLRLASDTNQLRSASPRDWQRTELGSLYRVDSSGQASYIAPSDAAIGAIDTALVQYNYTDGSDSSIYWIAKVIRKPEGPEKDISAQDSFIAELTLPYPDNEAAFESLRISPKTLERQAFFQRWQWPLKAAILLLLAALAWVILRWDQYRRAKVVAELQRSDRAPYLWNPETGLNASEYLQADAAPLLTRLRGRSPDEREQLDLAATVQASIRAGGRILLCYRRSTLPPDYLLLIDRQNAQDHQARLFEALYQVFVQAEVPIARYFYEDDPRTCYNESHPEGIALSELWLRHAGANLLLVGEGQGLLSNLSGRIALWTKVLEAWPRRALLLTRPRQAWGRREKELQNLLPLLPASPGGLGAVLDLFNAEDPVAMLPELLKNVPDALHAPFTFEHELIPDLQDQFSPVLVDWIAACALWPTLHWDLTLYLGKVLGEIPEAEGQGEGQTQALLGFAGIRELSRIPWFVEGRIPDAARAILIEYLQQRGLEQPLRRALAQLMQDTPPPAPDSIAYDDYRMNLMVNELFLQPDPARKRELEREFERYLAMGKQPDFVALQVLNRPQTRLDVLVGQRLKKYAFKGGLPGLGWQLWTKLLGIWLVLGLGLVFVKPFADPCPGGKKIPYKGEMYCLQDERDRLLYLEVLAADAIASQSTVQADSLVRAADQVQAQDSAFYLNTATRYYNKGAELYNCSRQANCSALPPDSLRSLACDLFQRGAVLDSIIRRQLGVEYYRVQQLSCGLGTPPKDTATFVLQGTVLDALTQKTISGAIIKLGNQSVRTQVNGQYQFRVSSGILGNSIELQVTATGYEPNLIKTPLKNTLPVISLSPLITAGGGVLSLMIDTISITRNNPNVDVFIKALNNNQPWDLKADNIVISEKIGANGSWMPLAIQNVAQHKKVRKEKPKPQDGNFIFLLDVSTAMTQQALAQAKTIIKKIINTYSITGTELFTIKMISDNQLDNQSLITVSKKSVNQQLDTVKLRNRAPWLYLRLTDQISIERNLPGKTILILLSPGIDQSDSTQTYQHLPTAPELIDQLQTLLHGYPKFYIYPIAIGDSTNTTFLKQLPQITLSPDDEYAKQSIPAKLNQVVQGIEEVILATHQVKVQSPDCIFKGEQRYYKITIKVDTTTLESTEYPFKDGLQDDPIRTCYSSVSWVDSLLYLLVGLVILGLLFAFLVFFLPGIRKNRFKQKYVKPYRIEGNRRHVDQLTNRPIEEGEPSVYKCSQVTTLKTWIDFGWHCPNYPNCLNNPQFRCNGDGAPVNYQAVFDMQDSLVRKLNWLLFGAIGGFIGAAIYLGIKEIERSNANVFQHVSKDFNMLNNTLIGTSFGIGLIFMLSWIEERGQSRNISWLRILLRTFVGTIMSAFTFVIGFYIQYKEIVTNPFIGSLLTWLLFGLGLGCVLSIQSSIPIRKALLGGLLAGLFTFGVRLIIMQISADYFYLATVLPLLCLGAVLGYTLALFISDPAGSNLET